VNPEDVTELDAKDVRVVGAVTGVGVVFPVELTVI
jgi:hypothetical protein